MARSNRGISGFSRVANNLKKMGYYPTTDEDAGLIGSWLEGQDYLILDPCCGSGKALQIIEERIDGTGEAFGVEIEQGRAEEARQLGIGVVINEDFLGLSIERGSVGAVFLNPPYDTTEKTHQQFIERVTDILCEGGVLVLMTPDYELSGKTAAFLESCYRDIRVYRSTDPTFKQVILFGVRTDGFTVAEGKDLTEAVNNAAVIPEYERDEVPFWRRRSRSRAVKVRSASSRYVIPKTKKFEDVRISFKGIDPARLREKLDQFRADWERLLSYIPEAVNVKRPILPLRKGHIAQVLASGLTDGVIEDPGTGERYLIKGSVNRETEVIEDEEQRREITRDVVSILKMDCRGSIQEIR
jgi:SAM-dependent methyltransferase